MVVYSVLIDMVTNNAEIGSQDNSNSAQWNAIKLLG
jgi:hypothetical protein